jgi:hypothetical protein
MLTADLTVDSLRLIAICLEIQVTFDSIVKLNMSIVILSQLS